MGTANSYNDLRQHIGHKLECVCYGEKKKDPHNVAIECVTCGAVLLDYDHPDMADECTEEKGFFPVTYVTRDDIITALNNKKLNKKIMKLTDVDMRQIARKMNECFCETDTYWEFLRSYVPDMLKGACS